MQLKPPLGKWPRRLLVPVPVACLVLFQVGVPTVQLLRPGPQRFGWQMYARWPAWPVVQVHAGSTLDSLDLGAELPYLRTDVRLPDGFGRQVCSRRPDADSVVVLPAGTSTPCRR